MTHAPALTVTFLDHRTTRTHKARMVVRAYDGTALARWQNGGRSDKQVQGAAIDELRWIHKVYKDGIMNDFNGFTEQINGKPHRNRGFEATSIKYEELDMFKSAWVVRGFGEVGTGLVVSEEVMQQAGIEWPEGCEQIELNTENLAAIYDPQKRGEGIVRFEPLKNGEDWEQGFGEIPY